ncbi:MAG: hypothetical protein WCF61_00400 [Terriglobales bacterium]
MTKKSIVREVSLQPEQQLAGMRQILFPRFDETSSKNLRLLANCLNGEVDPL